MNILKEFFKHSSNTISKLYIKKDQLPFLPDLLYHTRVKYYNKINLKKLIKYKNHKYNFNE